MTATLHPDIAPLADFVPSLELTREALPDLRSQMSEVLGLTPVPLSDDVERTDHVVGDDPHVIVRVYRPKGLAAPAPCIYSVHGGGYVLGTYEMGDPVFDRWCVDFGCIGVSVEYRLAPETPYPGPLDDCYRGLQWTFDHAADLGIDGQRIGIEGTSAGGGLAAALALLARDRGELDVAFQLLQCPMIDDRQVTRSSRYDDLIVWTREANTFGWRCYLGDLYGGDVPAYAAAARADDVSGLPPAFVITGGADGFRDENIDYALRLGEAGVDVDLFVVGGAPHGAQLFQGTGPARRWDRAVRNWLQPRLAPKS